MKKKIVSLLMFALFATTGAVFADPNDPVERANEKVTKSFETDYRSVSDLKWFESEKFYTAVFRQNDIQVKARYDKGGQLLGSTRYYKEEHLPAFLLNKLKKKYASREIFGVTEVMEDDNTEYYIKMSDDKFWYTVKVSPSGTMGVTEKYRKAPGKK